MDSFKSLFASANKENNLDNQQNGYTGRWATTWNRNMQAHSDSSPVSASVRDANRPDSKRKDIDNYFYIMWRA